MRSLSEIAVEIITDYRSKGKPVYYAAAPYVDAMRRMDSLSDNYGADSGDSVVSRALYNLSYWRGETATRVKRELRIMLHDYRPDLYPKVK